MPIPRYEDEKGKYEMYWICTGEDSQGVKCRWALALSKKYIYNSCPCCGNSLVTTKIYYSGSGFEEQMKEEEKQKVAVTDGNS